MLRMSNEWGLIVSSIADGTRPSNTYDTTVTPGTNAMGSWAQLLAGGAFTSDIWDVEVVVSSRGTAAIDHLVDIGIDPAGGTSYAVLIEQLVTGPSSPILVDWLAGTTVFHFPLRIPAGASVAARASAKTGTAAIGVSCTLRGRPSRPELCWAGSFVTTFGATLASSNGTTIVPGTVAEGTWTQVGIAATKPHRYLEFGYGIDDAALAAARIDVDIGVGDAGSKRVVIQGAPVLTATSNNLVKPAAGRYCNVAVGDILYARAQSSAALDTNNSVAIYAVG